MKRVLAIFGSLMLLSVSEVYAGDEGVEREIKSDVVTEADVVTTVERANRLEKKQDVGDSIKVTNTTSTEVVVKPREKRFSLMALGGYPSPLQGRGYLGGIFSAGLAMGFDFSQFVGLEGSFIFSEYELSNGYHGYIMGSHTYYDQAYREPGYFGHSQATYFDEMRQFIYGMDLLFRPFGRNPITPVIGVGLAGLHNKYFAPNNNVALYSTSYSQQGLAWDGVAGLDVNLSRDVALTGRFKLYSLITDRSNYTFYPAQSGSNNEYYQVLGGLAFRL